MIAAIGLVGGSGSLSNEDGADTDTDMAFIATPAIGCNRTLFIIAAGATAAAAASAVPSSLSTLLVVDLIVTEIVVRRFLCT